MVLLEGCDRKRPVSAALVASGLAPEHAGQLPRVAFNGAEVLADVGERGAQLRVTDFDREHGVLKLGQHVVGGAGLGHGAIDLGVGVPVARRGLRERPGGEAGAGGKGVVRAASPSVRDLHGPEQRALEPVAGGLVNELIGRTQCGKRRAEVVGGLGGAVEDLLAGFGGAVGP